MPEFASPDLQDRVAVRRALSKISWRILPLLGLGYGIAYMDRTNISFAALQMGPALGFTATVYGFGAGLFFLSYGLMEVPANLAFLRFGARRWIARIMLTWGALAIAMMLVRAPWHFYVMRLLLGAAEAGFFPGVLFYLMQWFPQFERARAISRFYIALPLSTMVMGALAGPLLGLNGQLGLAGWQWLFLLEGLPALLLGAIILLLLPERPTNVRWLNEVERGALEQILANEQHDSISASDQRFLTTLRDPVVILLGAINFINLAGTYAFTLSAPAAIRNATHLDAAHTGYVVALVGLTGVGAMLGAGWHSDYRRERYLHLVMFLTLLSAGYLVMTLPIPGWLFIGVYCAVWCSTVAFQTVLFTLPCDLMQGRKAAIGIAIVNSIGMIGAFVGPYLWGISADRTGSFRLGLIGVAIIFALAIPIVLTLRGRETGRIQLRLKTAA